MVSFEARKAFRLFLTFINSKRQRIITDSIDL